MPKIGFASPNILIYSKTLFWRPFWAFPLAVFTRQHGMPDDKVLLQRHFCKVHNLIYFGRLIEDVLTGLSMGRQILGDGNNAIKVVHIERRQGNSGNALQCGHFYPRC